MNATLFGATRSITPDNDTGVVDAVRDAFAQRTPLRIAGRGTWLGAGRSVTADAILDTSALSGIVEYVPGDLTLTARAGTTLEEIEAVVGEHRQWLPLDPFGNPRGTLGATLATASAGPLAGSIGRPRDVVLGLAFVTGDGRLARGGGRVVKNVAGFDIVRLMVGAWGTLGVLTEASVRLRARPSADETLALPLPEEDAALAIMLDGVRSAAITPLAAELLSPTLSRRLGLPAEDTLLLRLAGNPASVRAQQAELARIGATRNASADVWASLRRAEPEGVLVVRLSRRPAELGRLWRTGGRLSESLGGEAHASLERGVVRCWLPEGTAPELAEALASLEPMDVRIFERLPSSWWSRLAPSGATEKLSLVLRDRFDPGRILNRGLLWEETA